MHDTTVTLLLWALPIALGLHVFEEFGFPGGLQRWIRDCRRKKPNSDLYYVIINAAAIFTALAPALMGSHPGLRVYGVVIAVMAANSLSHIRGTIQMRRYCPGTVSGSLLLLPLFVVSYWYFLAAGTLNLMSAVVNVGVGALFGFYLFGVDIRKARSPA